jgi:N6-adenosine-specific RNA methylase IME4
MSDRDDNATWGELREGLHVAGYSFERACARLEQLLAGNRWKVGGRFKDVNAFLDSLRFDNLRASAEARKRIAARIKALQPKASNRQIAKTLGVGKGTVDRDVRGPNGPRSEKKMNQISGGGGPSGPNGPSVSGAQAARVVARHERVRDQQETACERVAKVALDAGKLGKFSLILADPPWDDEFGASNRSIENHYPTMKFEDICALPVSDIAHDQAVLFLWATPSMVEMALTTARSWGFEYRTQMVWVKPSIGLGKYVRQRHELLLICRRGGHPAPDPTSLPDSVIEAPRGKHSEKPEVFFEIIERMYPDAERIELFRRGGARNGWVAWGAESDEAQLDAGAPPSGDRAYDANADFAKSYDDCLRAVRERVAAGGPGWEPKAPAADDDWPELPGSLRRTAP